MAELAARSFPPDFQTDTDYLAQALTEHNLAAGTCLRFHELDPADRSKVLSVAQGLKDGRNRQPKPVPAIVQAKAPSNPRAVFPAGFFARLLGRRRAR